VLFRRTLGFNPELLADALGLDWGSASTTLIPLGSMDILIRLEYRTVIQQCDTTEATREWEVEGQYT
jgi:hypothetical protein